MSISDKKPSEWSMMEKTLVRGCFSCVRVLAYLMHKLVPEEGFIDAIKEIDEMETELNEETNKG